MSVRRFLVLCLVVLCGAALLAVIRAGKKERRVHALEVENESFPLRIRSGNDVLVLDHAPTRILPAFASAVDFLVDLVPRERVVALPSTASEWSALAGSTSEWNALPVLAAFSAEEVLALSPDLVMVQTWLSPSTIEALRRRNIPVLDLPLPTDWQGILQTIRALGTILDVRERAESVVSELEARRLALANRPRTSLRALCYSNRGGGGDTAGRNSTGDLMLELAGLSNAAREIGLVGNPPIDHETILALAPDLFVVAAAETSITQSPAAEYLRTAPKLSSLPAIRAGRIAILPAHLFSTASHRVLEAAEELAALVADLPPADGLPR